MKKVLVVEDAPDTAELMKMALARRGVVVRVARTGTRAMRRFWAGADLGTPYGVYVLDCALPKLSGWNVAANIRRAEDAKPDLPRAVLIGYTGYGEQAETYISDRDFTLFDRMFTKPAEPLELVALVERAAKGESLD